MNSPIRRPVFPAFPNLPESKKYESQVEKIRMVWNFVRDLVRYLDQFLSEVVAMVNSSTQGVGDTLASATAISPSWPIHHVSGTATISTINPTPGFSGPLFLVADGAWSTTTGGNIHRAISPTVGTVVMLVYDNVVGVWYTQT